MRCASIVNSICSLVPGLENSVPTLASAINFFSSGENASSSPCYVLLSRINGHRNARSLAGRCRGESELVELLFHFHPIHFEADQLPRDAIFVVFGQRALADEVFLVEMHHLAEAQLVGRIFLRRNQRLLGTGVIDLDQKQSRLYGDTSSASIPAAWISNCLPLSISASQTLTASFHGIQIS